MFRIEYRFRPREFPNGYFSRWIKRGKVANEAERDARLEALRKKHEWTDRFEFRAVPV